MTYTRVKWLFLQEKNVGLDLIFDPRLIKLILCILQVRNEFYKDSQGVILVYDVGLRESFDALDSWLTEMKQEMGSQANMENIIFVVCANKVPQEFKYLCV